MQMLPKPQAADMGTTEQARKVQEILKNDMERTISVTTGLGATLFYGGQFLVATRTHDIHKKNPGSNMTCSSFF